jgi:hypothetical protein
MYPKPINVLLRTIAQMTIIVTKYPACYQKGTGRSFSGGKVAGV